MKREPRPLGRAILSYLFLIGLMMFGLFPAIWMFITSIKPMNENFTIPPRITVQQPTLMNYHKVLFESGIPRAFLNSIVVTCSATLITLVIAILAGYGFSRFRFRGSKKLSSGLLYGQMMPGVVIIMPIYMTFSKIGIIDSYLGLIIANVALTIPMSVIMLTSFFKTVPRELEEAAKIDGTTTIGALFRIILPVSSPGLIAVSVYAFLHIWEEFLFALNLSNSDTVRTLPIGITHFSGEFVVDWGAMMGASVLVSVPVLIIFLLCSKYFVQGLSDGSVKG